ncbi:nucleolar MIF4G domain-containing protein 1-like [Daphnia carinata]|uniref:nucleolar MIF4G domain-containing protein 1-like n=1 Tax=Daphnia carinata TaxID=120202 RepID=UPI0025806923|nr:nucleolar MIF4G domain-containing protein 1-like [Daphnia carinata]
MAPRELRKAETVETKTKSGLSKIGGQRLGPGRLVTRKMLRKNLRKIKKQKKQGYKCTTDFKDDNLSHAPKDDCSREDFEIHKQNTSYQAPSSAKGSVSKGKNEGSRKQQEIADQERIKQRRTQLKIANKLEDKNIKKIEKQLKLHKRKSKGIPKSFTDDGLDFLLEICDPESRGKLAKEDFDFADNDAGFEEDLALYKAKSEGKTNKKDSCQNLKVKKPSSTNNVAPRTKTTLQEDSSYLDESGTSCETDEEIEKWDSSESCNQSENEDSQGSLNTSAKVSNDNEEEYKEDIYGRVRDKKGNLIKIPAAEEPTSKYIPPGKRLATTNEFNADAHKLKRQMKGLFNRLAESNLPSIVSAVEKLYLNHSRHNMQEAINALIIESLVCQTLSPERLIMEHCVLIAALHANVGTEVGAQFLELVVRRFDAAYKTNVAETKELDNLILIVAHLYNFGLVTASLLKDILHMLAERFEEKDIEIILIILRTVGFGLRKDDPVSLKEIIFTLQTKAGQSTEQPIRIRFMLEILLAIRNNNMTKIPNFDLSHTEHLRKILRSITKKGDALCKLNISYAELLAATNRGRWWIVGSAWMGQGPNATDSLTKSEVQNSDEPQYSAELLEMARKQRMNTEVRRSIFCILMTAEDFLEAFDRLMRLGLKTQQEREIVHVVMDCCLQEKSFNQYYAYLLQKLCHFHRRFQIASQFALWDHFQNLALLSELQVTHLSKLVVHLTVEGSLSLSVLKVIQFSEMDRVLVRFLRQVLLGILLHPSETAVKSAFGCLVSPKLGLLKDGLILFMHHFLMKNMEKMSVSDGDKLRSRIQIVQEAYL